jgi:hypothetical protein
MATDRTIGSTLQLEFAGSARHRCGAGWSHPCPDDCVRAAWAQTNCNAAPLCSPIPAKLDAFATAAARRYNGEFEGLSRVRYWQAWNEPNLSLFFNPQFKGGNPVSPKLYRSIINAFYFAVKSVSPSDLVIAAGLGPIERFPLTIGPLRFSRLLLCMTGGSYPHRAPGNCEGGVHCDIFDIHPYTTGGPAHEGEANDVEMGSLGRLQGLLAAADRAGRIHGEYTHTPLWITEFSWTSKPPNPHGLPLSILARWAAEALYVSWRAVGTGGQNSDEALAASRFLLGHAA